MTRSFKQVAYGGFYLAFFIMIFFGLRGIIRQAPSTCTDNIQNQGETEVDCGGSFCQSCEIKRLLPIQFSPVVLLPGAADAGTTALVEIRNKNPRFGIPKFSYAIRFYGTSTEPLYEETDSVAIYPSEVKYRLIVNAPVDINAITRTVATATAEIAWRSVEEFSRPKLTPRAVKLEYSQQSRRGAVTGYIKNDNPFAIHRVTINALIPNANGSLAAASKTFVQDLVVGEERYFKIDVRFGDAVNLSSLADPQVSFDAER